MRIYRIHSYNVVKDLDLPEAEVPIVHPAVLFMYREDRHVVKRVEGSSLLGGKRLAVFGRIQTELAEVLELCFGLRDEGLRIFYYGCEILEELRIGKLGCDEF